MMMMDDELHQSILLCWFIPLLGWCHWWVVHQTFYTKEKWMCQSSTLLFWIQEKYGNQCPSCVRCQDEISSIHRQPCGIHKWRMCICNFKLVHYEQIVAITLSLGWWSSISLIRPSFKGKCFSGDDAPKEWFNFWHSQCRIKIECAFGLFIMRWKIFWQPLLYDLCSTAIIHACMRLHNSSSIGMTLLIWTTISTNPYAQLNKDGTLQDDTYDDWRCVKKSCDWQGTSMCNLRDHLLISRNAPMKI